MRAQTSPRMVDLVAIALLGLTWLAWWSADTGAASWLREPTMVMIVFTFKAALVLGYFPDLHHASKRLWFVASLVFAVAAIGVATLSRAG